MLVMAFAPGMIYISVQANHRPKCDEPHKELIKMLYRKVPKTRDELSILGFGCMRLPSRADGTIDGDRSIAQIRYAIDHGVNYLDSAWNYLGGQSERILGRALRDGHREKVRIATRLPQWKVTRREEMDDYLNEQLEKLGVHRIDDDLLHAVEGNSWDRRATLGVSEFLDPAAADGRIGNAGFSFHGVAEDSSYCMPCPSDVRIPACFEIYNTMHMFNTGEMAKFQYAVLLSGDLTGRPGYASECVECGECLEKCPQHIEIPEVLARVAAEMETDDMADKIKMVLKTGAE
jgi:predicted aldo/keto reductase-like oxidoreductase